MWAWRRSPPPATGSAKPTRATIPSTPRGELLDRAPVGLDEVALQVEVLGRVAGEAELGEDRQVGALVAGAADPLGDLRRVAVDVADRRVDLGEGYPHLVDWDGAVTAPRLGGVGATAGAGGLDDFGDRPFEVEAEAVEVGHRVVVADQAEVDLRRRRT